MRKSMAVPAVVVALALAGCGQSAIDPSPQPVSAEEARELAKEVHAEIESGGGAAH